MSETPALKLPLLAAEQAQKHVTMNEALGLLDAVVQLSVKDRDLAAPPATPAEGDRYIVAAGATGAWAGKSGQLAVRQNGGWTFRPPREGWRCWIDDENVLLIFDGAAWSASAGTPSELQNLTRLGIATAADATNPFSAKLNKALWTARTAAEGGDGDLRYAMNKEVAADTVSLLFQTGFSGRAEIGLIGDDDLTFKVSANGSAWLEALKISRSTGLLTTLGQIRFPAAQNASADANVLDDYEEGTFTPTFSAATPPADVAYSLQSGRYTKIGRLVLIEGRMMLTSKGTGGAGLGSLQGLPFSASTIGFSTQMRFSNVTIPSGSILGALVQGSNLLFQSTSSAGAADVTWASFANNFDVLFTAAYSTAT